MDNNGVKIERPDPAESAAYFHRYIDQVVGTDAISILRSQYGDSVKLFESIPESKWNFRYEEGKWTIKELLIHLLDAERIFTYRALRLARKDKTSLPGFEQDDYVPECGAAERSSDSIISEYQTVREATISLFENLPEASLSNMAEVSGRPMSCRALVWIILGHEVHHCRILKDRYL